MEQSIVVKMSVAALNKRLKDRNRERAGEASQASKAKFRGEPRNEAIPVMEAGGRVKIHRCTMFIH